jgi:hypothetical protein
VTDEYQTVIMPSQNVMGASPGRFEAYEDSAVVEDRSADFEPNLVSLAFLGPAIPIRRRPRCC